MEPLFKVTIPGRCYVKKNGAKVYNRKKVYTEQYVLWQRIALLEMRRVRTHRLSYSFPLHIEMHFYFKDRQGEADLSNLFEGPCDVLKQAGIIVDDKLVDSFDGSRRHFYDLNPRTEITLFRYIT